MEPATSVVAGQAASPPRAKGATDFCGGCAACPYRSHACPLTPEKMRVEHKAVR